MTKTVGKYKVLSRIGKGGMGEVFRAIQTELEREVALKVLSEDVSASKATERFLREAQLQAQLEHPNLVRVYDVGSAGDRLFFAMEMVRGKTISKVLSEVGRPHPTFVAKVARQMASAFLYYHPKGMVHRDIKPSNLMICDDEDETLKMMDFGIALRAGDKRLTRTRAVVGTARYLSPEMARGEELDGASDVYQLGIVLYEMVCGSPPHSGPPAVAIARRAAGESAPDPRKAWPACPERLAHLINGCLMANPEERIPTDILHEEAEALELKLKGWEPPTEPVPPWTGDTVEPEELDGAMSGRRSPISGSGPASGLASGPASAQLGSTPGDRRVPAMIGGGVLLVLLVLGKFLASPGEYRAEEMLIRAGARGMVLSWASKQAYESRIRFGPEGTPAEGWSTAVGTDDGLAHSLVLEGLEPGIRYRFHVLFPDGKKSLDYGFQAPEPFSIRHLRVALAGAESLEWRFRTPVPVRAEIDVEPVRGETVRLREDEPSEDHQVKLPLRSLVRAPRKVKARFAAVDGEVEVPWPTDTPLGLIPMISEAYSPRGLDWPAFVNQIDEIRYRRDEDGSPRGFAQDQWQRELGEVVKARVSENGLLENWSSVAPLLAENLGSDAPWSERRRLLTALGYLSMLDRIHELFEEQPPFRIFHSLAEVMYPLPERPFPPGDGVEVEHEFPYSGNLLVPMNYSQTARDRINGMSTTMFPRKGDVSIQLEGSLGMPPDLEARELALGLTMRGIYPFFAVLLHLNEGSTDPRRAPVTIPFFQDADNADAPLRDEFAAIMFVRNQNLDKIFPVRELWMRVPREVLGPGENSLRVEILSLQHHTIFPSVVKKIFALAR